MKGTPSSVYNQGKETATTLYDTVIVYPIIFLPVLIMFYIVTSTFLNDNSSALVYGIGFIITLVFTGLVNRLSLSNASRSLEEGKNNPSEYCFYGIPNIATSMIGYLRASPNASIIMYTFMYFISSTIVKNFSLIVNPLLMLDKLFAEDLDLLIFFSCLLYFGKKVENKLQCNNESMNGIDYVNGMIVGFFAFWAYVTLFFVIGKESFFIQSHFLSNKKYCNTPSSVTYRCENTPIKKKYILVSNKNYIENDNLALQPHKDNFYEKGNVNIPINLRMKSIYLAPGTKINCEVNGNLISIHYDDISTDEAITMLRASRSYNGDTNNITHYVGVRRIPASNASGVVFILSVE